MEFKEFIQMLIEINGQAWVDANKHELDDMSDSFIIPIDFNLLSDPNKEHKPSELIDDLTFFSLELAPRLYMVYNLN